MAKKKSPSFESALNDLELLVKQMDSGELSLEDSLASFEKGIALIRDCQSALQNAEQKVQVLLESNGELHAEDFEENE